MKFCELLHEKSVVWGNEGQKAQKVCALCHDSRSAGEGTLYFCLSGQRYDGHDFAADAYRRGCRHFVCERPLSLPGEATILLCPRVRRKMAELSSRFYGNPVRDMTVIGVTGTKGKTTTALMIRDLLTAVGRRTAYVGSLGALVNNQFYDTAHTTPDSPELFRYLSMARKAGEKTVVLEVSSQALAHDRVYGIPFSCAAFTNLTRDHIGEGEHGSMEEYAGTKLRLFTEYAPSVVVLNAADPFSRLIRAVAPFDRVISYGLFVDAEYRAERVKAVCKDNRFSTEFFLHGPTGVWPAAISFAGGHYVENLLGALAVSTAVSGLATEAFLPYIAGLSVPGRCEVIPLEGAGTFVIDYAHNGAALAAALRGLRPYVKGRLLCLFGAVGERAQCRRRDMADAAEKYADFSVITEDDPGAEDPLSIATEILSYFSDGNRAVCIPDRAEAIRYLYGISAPGDIVLLAGKGNERYQRKNGVKFPFSEAELLRSL